ncbi:MAG TPA: oxidoreductase [Solirubrobacteraceae bacterium]|jgi:NAD(P)-dependent dehydrogenase (short-subunit alcohol dehydrogenase family)|nr:oxidoreductase [Solirubrobacteraceae bacterium]
MARWTAADIPDQAGRQVVVTGANSGLGLATTRELARGGASVVMACRNADKGRRAVEDVRRDVPSADVRFESLDLADLSSVQAFARRLGSALDRLDLLVNNAGVMAPPRRETVDGFESQLGTNHLGHFALTGRLLALLSSGRVVTLSSIMHRIGRLKLDDLQMRHRYVNWLAYGQSKLANLMFAIELQRRATAAGTPLLSLAAHPGYSATNLQLAGPATAWERWGLLAMNKTVAQTADEGALPTLYAATMPGIPGGSFIGPDGFMEMRGHPRLTTGAGRAYDEDAARRLWDQSEQLTGVRYEFPVTAVR